MADWHPIRHAQPVEWTIRTTPMDAPTVIIRKLEFGDHNNPETWFRVVTAVEPEKRELIGYCRTLEDAAQAGWDYSLALGSWQHHLAGTRADPATNPKPPAADMLRVYREINAQKQG